MATNVVNPKPKTGLDITRIQEQIEVALSSITVKDMAIFARQFAAMFNAGVAIVRCLSVLHEQCSNARLKRALKSMNADVQEGINLAEAMAKFPDVFDQLFISMVAAGEVGGVLDEVLDRLALMMEKITRRKQKLSRRCLIPRQFCLSRS